MPMKVSHNLIAMVLPLQLCHIVDTTIPMITEVLYNMKHAGMVLENLEMSIYTTVTILTNALVYVVHINQNCCSINQ